MNRLEKFIQKNTIYRSGTKGQVPCPIFFTFYLGKSEIIFPRQVI